MPSKPQPWHPRVRAFLAAYRATASITRAASAAGISRRAHYRKLETSEAYKAEFEAATVMAGDALEDIAVQRATEGTRRPLVYHGDLVRVPKDPNDPESEIITLTETECSDTLLLALLKAKKPSQYRDRMEHSGTVTTRRFEGSFEELLAMYRGMINKTEDEEK